jgi:MFS transporter, SHS family, lactate transporter
LELDLSIMSPVNMPPKDHLSDSPPPGYRNNEEELSHRHMSVAEYARTRIASLKPPMAKVDNPFKLLGLLNTQQWLFFLVAFLAWSWDAFDFFTVSLTVSDLAETFGKTNTDITWGITLVLMFRSVGSTIFGIAADRYGRKWYESSMNFPIPRFLSCQGSYVG